MKMLKRTDTNASCSVFSVFTVAKMFTAGVASVIQNFATVGGNLEFIITTLYLTMFFIFSLSCYYRFTPVQCAKLGKVGIRP